MFALTLLLAGIAQASPSAEMRHDDRGRPVISAQINDRGPFDMVVDTAAQTSLLTPGLIEELALPALDEQMTINGVASKQSTSLYPVERFSSDLFDDHHVAMLALPNASTTSARGIIGMERFTDSKVVFDRARGRLSVEPSGPAAKGQPTIVGTIADDGMLRVPVTVNGVLVQALVDSGAGPTVANAALLTAMGWSLGDERLQPAGAIRGSTLANAHAKMAKVENVKLGPVSFEDVTIVFSELGGGGAEPSMILGSNLLNMLSGYAIDFPRGELQLRLPPPPDK